MRLRRMGAGLAALATMSLGLTACGGGGTYASVVDKAQGEKKLVIGVKYDQPNLGVKRPDGKIEGFDVDVARYVAKELGVPETGITWKETKSDNREPFVRQGQVDLVFATFSILPERKKNITFGGPYIVAHQDTMVRADDNSITKPQDLKGKRICQAAGSNSYKRIIDPPPNGRNIKAKTVVAGGYAECVTKLKGKSLDAVSTDDLILAGFAGQDAASYKILGVPFTDEKYGVGIKKGDTKTCDAVNKAITKMYADGTAKQLLNKWFGQAKGLQLPDKAPNFEGCS
jgi:glutamate transport system substrate-binding protein